MNSCLAIRGDTIFSLLKNIATVSPLEAVAATCSLYRNPASMVTPNSLTLLLAMTSLPLIVKGVLLERAAVLVKWIIDVLSVSKVAPLRLSHANASSIIDCATRRAESAWLQARNSSNLGSVNRDSATGFHASAASQLTTEHFHTIIWITAIMRERSSAQSGRSL